MSKAVPKQNPNVVFLEFGLQDSKMPSACRDPYFLMWPGSRPKETHKTKIHKKTVNPMFNETFGFQWELDAINQDKGINDTIVMELHNYQKIGMKVIGKPFPVDLSTLVEGEERDIWVDVVGSSGKIHLTLMWYTLPRAEAPQPLLSHTGGSVAQHYNSLTRTAVKDAIRKGNRGAATDVEWLRVQVLQAVDLARDLPEFKSKAPEPFFITYLNSSKSVSFRGPEQKSTHNVTYSPPVETGFELVCVVGGSIRDALRVDFYHRKVTVTNQKIGSVLIPLDSLEPGAPVSGWYPLEGGTGKVELTLTRTRKAVSELSITGLNLGKRISALMFYSLACLRLKLAEYGLNLTIGISCCLGVIETRIGVCIKPTQADQEKLLLEQTKAEASVEEEMNSDESAVQSEKAENLSAFKTFMSRLADNAMNKFKAVLCEMAQHGLMGTAGISLKAGFPPYGLELALSIDVEMDGVPPGVLQALQVNYNTLLRSGIKSSGEGLANSQGGAAQ